MSFDVLIDVNADKVKKHGVPYIEKQIAETLNGRVRNLSFLPLSEFGAKIQKNMNNNNSLLIGGGDDAVVHTARILKKQASGHGKPFGVLPLGTQNRIAVDLNIAQDFTTALTQYWQYKRKDIDVGMVNGHVFLREAVIDPDLIKTDRLSIKSDACSRNALPVSRVVIGNNAFVKKPAHLDDAFKQRYSVTCGKLAVYIARQKTIFDTWKAMLNPFNLRAYKENGRLEKTESIDFFETEHVDIEIPQEKAFLIIDGDQVPLDDAATLTFQVVPKALPVIVPASR